MSIYSYAKTIYHRLLPLEWRKKISRGNNPISILSSSVKNLLWKAGGHDEIYNDDYYNSVDNAAKEYSFSVIANSIKREFNPVTVIDVGCGRGFLLIALEKLGIRGTGLEYATSALKYCQEKGLTVKKFDIESNQYINYIVDVCISTEVAEHLPASCADKFVDLLTQSSATVVMTAAPPGQGGIDHVNEQPNEYWIEKFQQRQFYFDQVLTLKLRHEWEEKKAIDWYYKNVMVFKKFSDSLS